jgi:hypothetical protein
MPMNVTSTCISKRLLFLTTFADTSSSQRMRRMVPFSDVDTPRY